VSARESLRYEAMHDGLTGLLNRRAVLEQLDKELLRSARRGAPVAVLMGDLDHFKNVNDTYGHASGDAVLKEAARRIKACVRAYDSIGRLGGEEFLAVLPECSSAVAYTIAERLGNVLRQTAINTPTGAVPVTISLGVSSTDIQAGSRAEELVRAADVALYRAKHQGRARACLAQPQDFATRRSGEHGAATLAPPAQTSAPTG
jgi:diguanylate cyclase (GGDEF)-like protein